MAGVAGAGVEGKLPTIVFSVKFLPARSTHTQLALARTLPCDDYPPY